MSKKIVKSCEFAGQKLSFEMGEFAPRANAAVTASMGETVVLATVTVSREDTDRDYFPLSVEFIEKFYAGGIISGSRFVKRERFPSEEAVLKARMIDRSMRPLFAKGFMKEVQIVITVLSYDEVNDPVVIGINAASVAACLAGLPFEGPVAGLKIGMKEGELVLNPSDEDIEKGDMEFFLSGKGDDIVMIDAGLNEVKEDKVKELFDMAVENFSPLLTFQQELIDEVKPKVMEVEDKVVDAELLKQVNEKYVDKIKEATYDLTGDVSSERRKEVTVEIIEEFASDKEGEFSKSQVSAVVEKLMKNLVREGILNEDKRTSGRKLDEVRDINCRTGILPRTHGSAFFARGITQALSIVTLGSTRLEQKLESLEGEDTKRYMHHYNGQSFSVGEAGRYNYYPGRREIGHGALAEKALRPMIPSEEEFPYTVRVVSEILAQQGSSSMAAVCGSTLSLMDAGVPIKSPVAGIAIGLVTSDDTKSYKLLTDVQDLEDFYGDMDFKVAGTKDGITAIQMDNKLKGINKEILKEALGKAKVARTSILEKMGSAIASPRGELSKYAPKIVTLKINPEKIGELIGPGGKVIRGIIEDTGVEIDVKDDGQVHISATSDEARQKAEDMVNAIVEEAEVGKVYEGEVAQIMPYGAFVDVSPSISGLVHVSEIADKYVSDPGKFLEKGQKVKVKVIGIDEEGRVNLSIKRAKENGEQKADKQINRQTGKQKKEKHVTKSKR
jgi:polyribonucleotide nucleotidyltransferase